MKVPLPFQGLCTQGDDHHKHIQRPEVRLFGVVEPNVDEVDYEDADAEVHPGRYELALKGRRLLASTPIIAASLSKLNYRPTLQKRQQRFLQPL